MREVMVWFGIKKTWIVYGTDCDRDCGRDPWKVVSVDRKYPVTLPEKVASLF